MTLASTMGGQNNDGGFLATLLIFCALDRIERLPGGYLFSSALSCIILIAAIIWLIVWAGQQSELAGTYSPPPPPVPVTSLHKAKGEPHSPTETSTETWWTNFFLLAFFLVLLTTPTCYYGPSYMRRRRGVQLAQPPAVQGGLATEAIATMPLLALPFSEKEVGERV
jgi:hypothetical protein